MLVLPLLPLLLSLCSPSLSLSFRIPELASRDGADTYVLTPHGLHPASNVHHVLAGSRVHHTSTTAYIIDANNNTIHTASIHDATPGNPTRRSATPAESGWVTYASWQDQTGSPISSLSSTWTVPATPLATSEQTTIFLFNAIQPAGGGALLQPVLQYGPSSAGGGAYWAAASWYLVGSQVYHTAVEPVDVGQVLTGVMAIESVQASTGTYTYHCAFTGVAGTALQISGVAPLVYASHTLEVYGVTGSYDYPVGFAQFTGITVSTLASATPPVVWAVVADDYADNLSTNVVVNGPVNAEIFIYFSRVPKKVQKG